MPSSRLLLPAVLSGLACLLVAPLALGDGPPRTAPSAVRDRTAAVAVLRDWDRSRAAAWRDGDPARLAGLYTADAEAGRSDQRLLASYADRGLRVEGMRMQVAEVVVELTRPDRVELVVTDRLVGAVAVGPHTRVPLPRDHWSRRRIVLVRVDGSWRVADVADQAT